MFNLFKKKSDAKPAGDEEVVEETEEEKKAANAEKSVVSDNLAIVKINTEIERMKGSIDGFQEVRKSFTDRFTRTSEQIGELRSMILERDKTIQEIELKAIKAYDLVDSVHPEKIMTEVQKIDAKIEALKANLEGNESIMDRIMEELKETKKKIEFFRGVEEIVKLSEEVKNELIDIKKVESKIGINTDKVETIYSEMRKKFQDVDAFSSEIQEMKIVSSQNQKDINFIKDRLGGLVEKEELEKLMNKVQRYIEALKGLEKNSSLTKDIATLKTLLDSLK